MLRLVDRQAPEMRQRLQMPLTRSDIGQRIGAQNETVIRILSQWTKNGWIATDERHIIILNRAELEKLTVMTLTSKVQLKPFLPG